MHDCGWIEGATCQEDHSLAPHPNLELFSNVRSFQTLVELLGFLDTTGEDTLGDMMSLKLET